MRFVGKAGDYISGVPPRDLSEAEWNALSAAARQFCRESGLYVEAGKPERAADAGAAKKEKVTNE